MIPASVGFQCPECVRAGNAGVRTVRSNGLRTAGRRWGVVTLGLIALNVAMFVVTAVSAVTLGYPATDNEFSPIFLELAQRPFEVHELDEWWRVITAAFLHIGPVHLAFNMLALLLFGSELERQLGWARYLAVYLTSALGGAVAIQLLGDEGRYVAGASAAIYGLLGALGVLMLASRQDIRGLLTLLAINVVISFLPGISLLGHLGGLLAGALAGGVLVLLRRRPELQISALGLLAVVLLVVSLTLPTLVETGF